MGGNIQPPGDACSAGDPGGAWVIIPKVAFLTYLKNQYDQNLISTAKLSVIIDFSRMETLILYCFAIKSWSVSHSPNTVVLAALIL